MPIQFSNFFDVFFFFGFLLPRGSEPLALASSFETMETSVRRVLEARTSIGSLQINLQVESEDDDATLAQREQDKLSDDNHRVYFAGIPSEQAHRRFLSVFDVFHESRVCCAPSFHIVFVGLFPPPDRPDRPDRPTLPCVFTAFVSSQPCVLSQPSLRSRPSKVMLTKWACMSLHHAIKKT